MLSVRYKMLLRPYRSFHVYEKEWTTYCGWYSEFQHVNCVFEAILFLTRRFWLYVRLVSDLQSHKPYYMPYFIRIYSIFLWIYVFATKVLFLFSFIFICVNCYYSLDFSFQFFYLLFIRTWRNILLILFK